MWVSVETSVQSWALGPLSLSSILLYATLLCSAFLNTVTLFFAVVHVDECLVILSSGGLETD